MSFLPPSAKLTNPTHKIVGPDGTEYFLIRKKGARLRIRILYEAPNWSGTTPAGSVSEGWGPTGADHLASGQWIGILAHHFTYGALEMLPDGTHCVETTPSGYFRSQVIWSGWGDERYPEVGFSRAGCRTGCYRLPCTRAERDHARPLVEAHLAALLDGTYRRDDGTPAPADAFDSFVEDARRAIAYLDFLDSVPALNR